MQMPYHNFKFKASIKEHILTGDIVNILAILVWKVLNDLKLGLHSLLIALPVQRDGG